MSSKQLPPKCAHTRFLPRSARRRFAAAFGVCLIASASQLSHESRITFDLIQRSSYTNIAAKYRSEVAARDDGMFQSQHPFSTFDSPDDSYASHHSSYNGGAPERMYGSSYSQSLQSGSAVNMYASGRAAAAPAADQGGCVFVRASNDRTCKRLARAAMLLCARPNSAHLFC